MAQSRRMIKGVAHRLGQVPCHRLLADRGRRERSRWSDLTPGWHPVIYIHSGANNAVFSRLLSPSPFEMEEELSAAVARFVLEAGGLKQGAYLIMRHECLCLLNPVYFSKGGFEGIC